MFSSPAEAKPLFHMPDIDWPGWIAVDAKTEVTAEPRQGSPTFDALASGYASDGKPASIAGRLLTASDSAQARFVTAA